jgi:hypothetical protein
MVYSSGGLALNYDGFGRETSVGMNGGTITRAYDADDHLISSQNLGANAITCVGGVELDCQNGSVPANSGATYTWGTSGHPVKFTTNPNGTGASTYWEHWDPTANEILLETGTSTVVALGRAAISNTNSGLTVEDRDPFGQLASTHTGVQFTAWIGQSSRSMSRYGNMFSKEAAGSQYTGTDPSMVSRILDAERPDGYIDHTYGISFQGTRTADVNTGQWMTPDAFGGDADDPMSQQPYAWDANNPLVYSDPSGFLSTSNNTPTPPLGGGCMGNTATGQIACSSDCTGWWQGPNNDELVGSCGPPGGSLAMFDNPSPFDGGDPTVFGRQVTGRALRELRTRRTLAF